MAHRTPALSVGQRDHLVRVSERLTPDQRSIFGHTVVNRLSRSPTDGQVVAVGNLVRAEIERGEPLSRA
jgi:hypothetical protein